MNILQVRCDLRQSTRCADHTQRVAPLLDRSDIPWKTVIVGFFLTQYSFESYLGYRQYRVLQRTKPPKSLEGEVSQEVFDKSQVRLA